VPAGIGGILNASRVQTIADGNVPHGGGGAIYNDGEMLEVDNSTFADNHAAVGCAIYNREDTTLAVMNSTFSTNSATLCA